MMAMLILAAIFEIGRGASDVKVEAPDRVDIARDFEVTVTANMPIPDLRDRFQGFSVAEDFALNPVAGEDGATNWVSRWRLVPRPCEKVYKLRPFAIGDTYTQVVKFEGPEEREVVTGGMEIEPKKDLPPMSWKLAGQIAGALAAAFALLYGIWRLVKFAAQKMREHKMSPIERALLELDRLIKRGLPGRGRYKDFYVELTMVVRRYVQRKYGVKAPNLTTEEFLREIRGNEAMITRETAEELRKFLENADMVKFAGVEATPEMADSATDSARSYLKSDSGKAGIGNGGDNT